MTVTHEPITAGSGIVATALTTQPAVAHDGTIRAASAYAHGNSYRVDTELTHYDLDGIGEHVGVSVAAWQAEATCRNVTVSKFSDAAPTFHLNVWLNTRGGSVNVRVALPADVIDPLRDALAKEFGAF